MRLKILTITLGFLFILGCSEGGDASFKNGAIIVPITVNCIGASVADIATYTPLQSGDTLVKDDDNTSVKIYHDVNGIKKVCLVSGSAHILR